MGGMMKNQKHYYNYCFLPEEIIMDILSQLPVTSVLQCRLVCKTWRNIVYNPYFAHMHLIRRRLIDYEHSKVSLFFMTGRTNTSSGFYFTLSDKNCEKSYEKMFRMIDFNPGHPSDYGIVGSCNGLVCVSDLDETIFICNPITRECVSLPCVINQTSCAIVDDVACGFGYLPSTNEYKVVRVCYYSHKRFVGRVQVYTLGGGTGWRDKGEISYTFRIHSPSPVILVNGALHWLDDYVKIVAFDLADEEFLLLPSPPCFILRDEDEYPFELQVFGGLLSVVHCTSRVSVDVWSLKKDKNGNNGDIIGRHEYQFWSWIKEFHVDSDLKAPHPTPIILSKHGEVLFYSYATLFRYDLKTATSVKLVSVHNYLSACHIFQAIPHSNSFVSLKALGEEGTKRIEAS